MFDNIKCILILVILLFCNISYSQINNLKYNPKDSLENIKQFATIKSCKEFQGELGKNALMRCFVEKISSDFDMLFNIDYSSDINATKDDFYMARVILYYDSLGNFVNYKVFSINGLNTKIIENTQKEFLDKLSLAFNKLDQEFLIMESAAKDFNDKDVGFQFLLSFNVKTKNNSILNISTSNNHYFLSDINDYKNDEKLKEQYSYFYKSIDKLTSGFKDIAKENNIEKAFAHVLFNIDQDGIIQDIQIDKKEGDVIFGSFLLEKFKSILEKDSKPYEVAVLKNGDVLKKEYRMSFSYGYK